ncbi:360_t:CDS:2, partial [Entrophospora sp. SA101]
MSATLPDIPKGACWDFVANFSDDSVEELLNKLSHDNSWKRELIKIETRHKEKNYFVASLKPSSSHDTPHTSATVPPSVR